MARNAPRTRPFSSIPVRSKTKISCMVIDVALHAGDFRDGDHLARAVGEAGDLDHGMNGAGHLLADGAFRNIEIGHGDHVLDAVQSVARGVGVNGGERALMAGVHGLKHVKGLLAAHLAYHDAVGAHTEAVDDELAHADRALAFDVGRAGFEADDVLLLELQFGRVFDGDDALGVRDVSGKNVEKRGFAGAGTAGNEQIQAALHHGGEQFEHGFGQGFIFEHVARGDGIAAEAADGEAGAVKRERRDNGVDAGAILQAGVHHGRRFIDAAADAGDDAVDDLHQVLVVFEREPRDFKLAAALDVDAVETVDENIGDGRILEQGLERAEAEDFVENFARQALAFGEAERNGFAVDGVADQDENFFAGRVAVGASEFFEVQAVQDLAMKIGLYLLIIATLEGLQISHDFIEPLHH